MTKLAVTVATGSSTKDLSLVYDDQERAAVLIKAIENGVDASAGGRILNRRTGLLIDPESTLANVDLLHGDNLELLSPDAPIQERPRLQRVGDVGPESVEIPPSGLRIGRLEVGNDLVLDDPTVSKAHASISCVGHIIVVDDLGSTNGTSVNGTRIAGETKLTIGDVVEFGDNASFKLAGNSAGAESRPSQGAPVTGAHLTRAGGRLHVSRPWRQIQSRPVGTITVGPAPQTANARRFPLPMIILPVVMGLAVVAFTGNVAFLAFGLLGPLMAGWNWYDDRRSGRKQYQASIAKFDADLGVARTNASDLQDQLEKWLEWSTPRTSDLVEQAQSLSPSLWDRQPGNPDFLDVRIGTGSLPAPQRVEVREGGADELMSKAHELRAEFSIDASVPISCSLSETPVLAIVSDNPEAGRATTRAMIVQLAVRNSPNDVRVAAIGGSDWSWMSWLPHVAPFPDGTPMIASDGESAGRVIREVETLIESAAKEQRSAPITRHLVLVVEPPTDLPAARLNAVLSSASEAGVIVIWIADSSGPPPRSSVVVRTTAPASVQRGSGEAAIAIDQLEQVDVSTAATVARCLAPLVDPGTGSDTTVPDRVGLFEVLGEDCLLPDAIVRRWDRDPDDHLYASVGTGKDGVVRLDLSNAGDGPNGLVAGTVGSGKSEFLQSLVLSLAVDYGPESLNLLFVDFKGGLTFRDLVGLPHCVGMVRNLDGQLAIRARRSLQAELRRRQRILHEHGAVNLTELRERAPDQMLPALVVIIDEYAELAQKLPEFLEGVVEIAQTGRALGIHLLLATQAPGQSVSRIIQNCVKYRISFRLKDSSESMEVLGRGRDASTLPNRPGRGLLLDGNNQLHEFQAAWAGGRSDFDQTREISAVTMYRPKTATGHTPNMPTDLERVVEAIQRAATIAGRPLPRRPWHEPLPNVVRFESIETQDRSTAAQRIPIGMVDLPDEQLQRSYDWDISESQNLLLIGDGRSGKTTALRTIAASANSLGAEHVEVIGIDATGGGLSSIDVLPVVRAVVMSSDTSRLRRAVAQLLREEQQRQAIVGRAGSLDAYRRSTGEQIPDLIVLIDGLVQLLAALEVVDGNTLWTSLQQLITDGAAMGIHFAMTTDQPQRVPMSIRNTARERLVFRMSSRDAASAAEVQRDLSQLPDGRAISTLLNAEVQMAGLGDGDVLDGPAQARALEHLAVEQTSGIKAKTPAEPKDVLRPTDLPAQHPTRGSVVIGIDDLFLEPVILDLSQTPTLVIAGPDVSGRTSAIAWIRQALLAADPELTSIYVSGRGDRPPDESSWSHVPANLDAAIESLESLAESMMNPKESNTSTLLVIDDGDDLLEAPLGGSPDETKQHRRLTAALDTIVKNGRTAGVIVILAGRLNALSRASGWAQRLRQNQQALILAPATLAVTVTDPMFNVTLPRRSDFRPAPGRGVLLRRGVNPELIQVVYP